MQASVDGMMNCIKELEDLLEGSIGVQDVIEEIAKFEKYVQKILSLMTFVYELSDNLAMTLDKLKTFKVELMMLMLN